MISVFLSHSASDKEHARKIAADLDYIFKLFDRHGIRDETVKNF